MLYEVITGLEDEVRCSFQDAVQLSNHIRLHLRHSLKILEGPYHYIHWNDYCENLAGQIDGQGK